MYDDVERHYHVITYMTSSMAKKYVCKALKKRAKKTTRQFCEQICGDCMARTPYAFLEVRNMCTECNRHFRCRECFDNHKQNTTKRKSACERKPFCANIGVLKTSDKHECNKRFCEICK